jgi:tRNA 2-selenouridine synthase
MPRYEITDDLSRERLERFDAIIDVRSPSEFAEDHLPGAINLPVLDDTERADIGTQYKQVSTFDARKHGAALVAKNIAHHIDTELAEMPADFRPLIYCWRGGMRSESMALILSSIGWKVAVLKGGYRTWRRGVVDALEHSVAPFPLVLIDGHTGSGKTAILTKLAENGEQVVDLEGLAQHRGSVFGGFGHAEQPSQKRFDSGIWDVLRGFDHRRPIYVEAESSLVGRRRVPNRLWAAMKAAPRIEIQAPPAARAEFLVRAYPDLLADGERLIAAIERLAPQHGNDRIAQWRGLAHAGEYTALAESLVTDHYDPAYARSKARHGGEVLVALETDGLDDSALSKLAEAVAENGSRALERTPSLA